MSSDDQIPVVSIDEPLPSGPSRRNRRRAHKESRSAAMGGRKEGDRASRRAARVSKSGGSSKDSDMIKGYPVIVSGLLPSTTDAQVRSMFHSVGGRIIKCTMGRQAGTNKPAGVAQVVFETSAQADKAARVLNKASVDGRIISVQARGLAFFTKSSKKAQGSRKKTGPKKKKETTADLDRALSNYMK